MFEQFLNGIKEKHHAVIKGICEYNNKITNGNYLEHDNCLDTTIYLNLIAGHIISLLINDKELYLSDEIALLFEINRLKICELVEWEINGNHRAIKSINCNRINEQLIEFVFNQEEWKFIKEICAQDIVYSNTLGKDIRYIFSQLTAAIKIDSKGEEEFWNEFCNNMSNGKRTKTIIEKRFYKELRCIGALIRNRVFKHQDTYKKILDEVVLTNESEELLDYRYDKNICQSALLHINIEKTGSCGTGFVISEDGYALTCAHVVEGAENAEEFYATIINGDGYSIKEDEYEGFEVYDSGYGKVVYSNKELDIALLKMEHYGIGFLPIEQREILPELGEEVVVFGYPLGYEMPQSNFFGPNISFYKGYVSSNQVWNGNSVTFLDIDVKSGNSGSPVISTKTGKVIGIISGAKVGSRIGLNEKMPYMIPIQHFIKLLKNN